MKKKIKIAFLLDNTNNWILKYLTKSEQYSKKIGAKAS